MEGSADTWEKNSLLEKLNNVDVLRLQHPGMCSSRFQEQEGRTRGEAEWILGRMVRDELMS